MQERAFSEVVDTCCRLLKQNHQLELSAFFREVNATDVSAQFRQIDTAWPATFVVEYALAQLFLAYGIHPQALYGDGLGEYVAACLSGVLSCEDALTLIVYRAQLIASLCSKTPHADLAPMFDAAQEALSSFMSTITLHPPHIPYISCVTGTWISNEQATSPAYWVRLMSQTVYAVPEAAQISQAGQRALLTIGIGGQSLNALTQQQASNQLESPAEVIPTLSVTQERQSGTTVLIQALGQLWSAGVTIDWQLLYSHERRLRVPLPTYPFERQRYWLDDPTNCNVVRSRTEAASQGQEEHLSLSEVRPPVSTDYVAPESITEKKITEIWQLLLGVEQIGIHDNFFELKGQSLIGTQVVSRLQQIFQVNVPLATLFEAPTIAELATAVETLLIEDIEKMEEEEAQSQI